MKDQISKAVIDRMDKLGETYRSVAGGAEVGTYIVRKIRRGENYEVGSLIKVCNYLGLKLVIKK